MENDQAVEATIVITTRNRKDDLCKAIDSALTQTAKVEVLVVDDASTDSTYEVVREKYPSVQIHRRQERCGLIVNRNFAATLANAPVIFSLDDDAVFTSEKIVSDVLTFFSNDRVGAVAMPIDDFGDGEIRKFVPRILDRSRTYVTSTYIGCGHALRRDLFLELGGYFEKLFHWGEETGFCQRLYGAGKVVAIYGDGVINHYPHPQGRHTREKNLWIFRNQFLLPLYNAPGIYLLPEWLLALARCIRHAIKDPTQLLVMLEGIFRGLAVSIAEVGSRRPVSVEAFRLFHRLKKEKVVALDDIADQLETIA